MIKTKKGYYVASVCILALVIAGVVVPIPNAIAQTPEPTWDIRTPPPTPIGTPDIGHLFPTVTATINNTCPAYVPIGYGTVTPGLGWELTCGHCLPDGTSTPTFDFNSIQLTNEQGTGTPTVTGTLPDTLTPTMTYTPTVTATPSTSVTFDTVTINGTNGLDYLSCALLGNGSVCDFGVFASDNSLFDNVYYYIRAHGSASNLSYVMDGVSSGTFLGIEPQFLSGGGLSGPIVGDNIFGSFYSTGSDPSTGIGSFHKVGYLTWPGDGGGSQLIITANGQAASGHTGSFEGTVYFYPDSVPATVTPMVPTPTGTPYANYCDVIDGSEYDYESWFDLIGLTGSQSCIPTPYIAAADYFGSGWLAFFGLLFPDEVVDFISSAVIPAQTWCFYGFGFTKIQLFTIQVDPTVFADIAIVLFVLYHFMNK